MRKGKRMKLLEKIRRYGQSLRTGLLVVRILCIVFWLVGCGQGTQLLSELRQEGSFVENDVKNAEETGGNSETSNKNAGESGKNAGEGSGKSNVGNTEGAGQEMEGGDAGNSFESETQEKTESIYVHICGAVVSPGVYELPVGSRFYEAVEKAGGFAEGASEDYLNMAAYLADGSRLEIPTMEAVQEIEKAASVSSEKGEKEEYSYYTVPEVLASENESTGDKAGGLVNINTADIAGLCELPGVGEGRAKAIIEYREQQGGFQKKEDIMQVSGIGEKMYARMESLLTVE